MSSSTNISWPGWETGRLIGRGSFGAVYEIKRDVFGDTEKAALKVISIPQNDGDIEEMYSDGYDDESITSTFQSHLKSIVAEYSLMRKMNGCANIVNCDDVRYVQHEDSIGWDIFIKMELLTPLTKALPADISEQTVRKIAKDMCAALEVCKKFDIVHRDIKPQNIFVSDLGDYKLGDFGIAKTVEKTMGGTKIGTYKYMAPEVYNNQPYGSSADIYSLGLVLYWLLNEKRMPFLPLPPAKLGAGLEEKARMRRFSGEALPAPAHGSRELKKIVLKACAFDPKERYASAADMMADLRALDGVASPVVAAPISTPKAEPAPVPVAMPTEPEPMAAEDKTVNAFAAVAMPAEEKTAVVAADEEKTAFVAPVVSPAPPAPAKPVPPAPAKPTPAPQPVETVKPAAVTEPEQTRTEKKKRPWIIPVACVAVAVVIIILLCSFCGGEQAKKYLQSISVLKVPDRVTYYIGEQLDTTGMQLVLHYSDGSMAIIEGDACWRYCSPVAMTELGTQNIMVNYEGNTAWFSVNVVPLGSSETPVEDLSGTYDIVVWVPDGLKTITEQQIDAFEAANPGIVINATVMAIDMYSIANSIADNAKTGADIFYFNSDQLNRLITAGALEKLTSSAATYIEISNDNASLSHASSNGDLWAYPLTSDNRYYIYYDTSIISEEDAESLEKMIACCEANGRKFRFNLESAWYSASFFFATGCHSNWSIDGTGKFISVDDNYNSAEGLIAMKGMQKLVKSTAYDSNAEIFTDAGVIVSGVWYADAAAAHFGENMGVADLPSFTVDGKSYHLGSFSSGKLLGVKPQTDYKYQKVLQILALHLSGKQCQQERYYQISDWVPSNKALLNSLANTNPALAGVFAQGDYSVPQRLIHGGWWDIAKLLETDAKDATSNAELQNALNKYQAAIDNLLN